MGVIEYDKNKINWHLYWLLGHIQPGDRGHFTIQAKDP
jgi:hypothetical protein